MPKRKTPPTPRRKKVPTLEERTKRADGRKERASDGRARSSPRAESVIQQLQQELATSRQYLQSVVQELEAANEELQSANERVLASNEELQSTNEELDAAKQELQSTNQELNTVNEELHGRNEELSRVNSDLVNVLGSVHIAIVIVTGDLRIRRFTPMAEKLLSLIPGDVGRPIGNIKPNIDGPDLEQICAEVIDTMAILEREVRDSQGRTYSLRVRPYRNLENRIEGAVLALF
jgi:two-component system CheB/CheR fusion protein